jgi:hypothetical protein
MTTEYLEQQLEKWKRVLLVFVGAGLTLAASTFGLAGYYIFSLGWIMAWLILQLGAVSAGLLLLFNRPWRRLPLMQRLNTAFGFLGTAWLGWLAIGFSISDGWPVAFTFTLFRCFKEMTQSEVRSLSSLSTGGTYAR